MSLFGSLFSGVSGLNAQSRAMGMISDNIANVNTTAYKGAAGPVREPGHPQPGQLQLQPGRRAGAELLHGGDPGPDPEQRLADRRRHLRRRLLRRQRAAGRRRASSSTPAPARSRPTSRAICARPPATTCRAGRSTPTRQIVDVNTAARPSTSAASTALPPPPPRSQLGANLDADQPPYAGAYAAGDLTAWNSSAVPAGVQPTFTRDVQVYDSLGRAHDLTLSFLRTGAANSWAVEICGAAGRRRSGHPPRRPAGVAAR